MDWLGNDIWVTWMAIGFVLLAIELFSGDLVFFMLGIAGISAGVASFFTDSVGAELAVFASMSVALLWLVRPKITARLHDGPTLALGSHRLVGQTGVVTAEVMSSGGRVKLGDQSWGAVADQTLAVGETVVVTKIDGATATVARKDAS